MNNNIPKISVLIPVYGVEKFIEQSSRSLFNNTIAEDCEFIFVDDKSPDKSIPILKKIISEYPTLNIHILFHEKNRGQSETRRTALYKATGEYIVFADSDDWVEPDYLEELYNIAKKNNYEIAICNFYVEKKGKSSLKKQYIPDDKCQLYKDFLLDSIRGYLWNKIYNRNFIIKYANLFLSNINMWEDIYLNAIWLYAANSIGYNDKGLYHYRADNSNSIVHSKNLKNYEDSFIVLGKIKDFLIDNNCYDTFKKEFQIKMLNRKMNFLLRYKFNNNFIKQCFSDKELSFLKRNIKSFGFSKRIFIFLFLKKWFTILNIICSLEQLVFGEHRIYLDYSLDNLSFFTSIDIE